MNEQEQDKLKLLLESSHERLHAYADLLTEDPAYQAAIRRDQKAARNDPSQPRKIA